MVSLIPGRKYHGYCSSSICTLICIAFVNYPLSRDIIVCCKISSFIVICHNIMMILKSILLTDRVQVVKDIVQSIIPPDLLMDLTIFVRKHQYFWCNLYGLYFSLIHGFRSCIFHYKVTIVSRNSILHKSSNSRFYNLFFKLPS